MEAYRFSLDVPVRSRWSDIERVRVSVQNCLQVVFGEVEHVDALAMVTGELLENAVKYGQWETEGGVFRLHVSGDETHGTVVVENPVADASGVSRVQQTLAFLSGFGDPAAAYQARLLEVARGPRGLGGGLGLLRVAYEGGARLSVEHQAQTGLLRVTAHLSFGEG